MLDLALAGCVAAPQWRLGSQRDSDWSLIPHLLCQLECSNNPEKLCIKDLIYFAQWETLGLLCSWFLPCESCSAPAIL